MSIMSFKGKYNFLSNMYPTLIKVNNEVYPSAEHAFQAMKSLDPDVRLAMSLCRSPEEAKQAGKLVTLRSDWEEVKVEVMHSIVRAKFSNNELAQKLLATGQEDLIEGNTWKDTFWGVCNGKGKNMLGRILMDVRKEITNEYSS